jgi:hypothetical protein
MKDIPGMVNQKKYMLKSALENRGATTSSIINSKSQVFI